MDPSSIRRIVRYKRRGKGTRRGKAPPQSRRSKLDSVPVRAAPCDEFSPATVEFVLTGERLESYARGAADATPGDEQTTLPEEGATFCDVVAPRSAAHRIDLAQLEGALSLVARVLHGLGLSREAPRITRTRFERARASAGDSRRASGWRMRA